LSLYKIFRSLYLPLNGAAQPAPPAQPIRSKRIWQKEIGGGSTQSSGRIRRGPRAREEIAESWLTRCHAHAVAIGVLAKPTAKLDPAAPAPPTEFAK
jgi:hypothetical protein